MPDTLYIPIFTLLLYVVFLYVAYIFVIFLKKAIFALDIYIKKNMNQDQNK